MQIYNVNRYKITDELRKAIQDHPYSMRKLSQVLGFRVRNIHCVNISIREDHLHKLSQFLNKSFNLEEIEFNFAKNLGIYSFTQSIRPFEKSTKLAEFFGIMLGDGNIHKNAIDISFDKRNEHYINHVKQLANELFNIELRIKFAKEKNTAHLYFYNKNLVKRLIKLGLKRGHKIRNQVGVPIWIKENENFAKTCIRGLIDTDGCIYKCKRENQTYVKFTNFNNQLLKDFKEMTNNLGYSFAKANKNNWCLYRKTEVAKFIKEIQPLKSEGAMG